MRTIRERGSASPDLSSALPYRRWEERGWLRRGRDRYVAKKCRCGSADLALIPTPEPDGLVCLECRSDRSGLVIPSSWNVAVADREYWEAAGYDVSVPRTPGLPKRQIATDVLPLR